MRAVKRVVVLSIELIGEAVLLGCWLGVLVAGEIGLLYGVVGSALSVPVVLFLHGYYFTRTLARIALRIPTRWLYPTIAAVLFVAHMYFAIARAKRDLTPFAQGIEVPFLAGGAWVVFACAYGGDWLLGMWVRRGSRQSAQKHRIEPSSANG